MNKYVSQNELETFRFHDSILKACDFKDEEMIWHVKSLCVEPKNAANHFNIAMGLGTSVIIFDHYKIIYGRYDSTYYNAYGKKSGEKKQYDLTEPMQMMQKICEDCQMVSCGYDYDEYMGDRRAYGFEFLAQCSSGREVYLSNIIIEYTAVTVSWESFEGKAWYVSE